MEDRIINAIEGAISQLPRLPFEKISTPTVERMEKHDGITKQQPINKIIPLFAKLMPLAAVAAMAVFGWYNQVAMVHTTIQIDVNPSVEITLNKGEKVLDVRGLNPDGHNLITKDRYKNQTLDRAIDQIMDDMAEEQYLGEDSDVILISTGNKDREDRERITQLVSDSLALSAAEKSFSPHIYAQELYADDYIEKQSEKMGISRGKMQLIQTLLEQNPDLDLSQLAEFSLRELVLLAKDRGLILYLDQKPYPNLGINIDDFMSEDEKQLEAETKENLPTSETEEEDALEVSGGEESSQPTPESTVPSTPPESSVVSQPPTSSVTSQTKTESSVSSQQIESSTSSKETPESSVSSQPKVDASAGATTDGSTGATTDGYTGATPDGSAGATD